MPEPMTDERLREIEEWVADETPHGFTEVALTECFEEIVRLRARKGPSAEAAAEVIMDARTSMPPDVRDVDMHVATAVLRLLGDAP